MTSEEIKEVKNIGSWFRLKNLMGLINNGKCFFYDLLKSQEDTVFKLYMGEETTMTCDYVSAKYLYEEEYVFREPFIGKYYNANMLEGRIPSMFCNGEDHATKKADTMKVLEYRMEKISLKDLSDVIESEMKAIDVTEGKGTNFEACLENVAKCVADSLILGKSLHNRDDWKDWFDRSLKLFNYHPWNFGEATVRDRCLNAMKQTPTVQNLDKILPETTQTMEGETFELMHNVHFNCTPVLSWLMISCIARFTDSLTEDERQSLRDEASLLFREETDSTFEERLSKSEKIDTFILEILRLNTPHLAGTYGRARKDFVMESKTGRYQIHKDDLLCTFVYAIHRDEEVFEDPFKLKMTRDRKIIENQNVCFGSPLVMEPTANNHKCPAARVMINVLKMFLAHFTRCDVNITSDVTCSYTSSERLACTDEPLVVEKFVYKE